MKLHVACIHIINFSFRRYAQDYKIQMDMKIVTFWGNQRVKPLQKCTTITKFTKTFKVSVQYKSVSVQKYNKNNGIRKNKFKILNEQRFSALQIIIKTLFRLYTNKLWIDCRKGTPIWRRAQIRPPQRYFRDVWRKCDVTEMTL